MSWPRILCEFKYYLGLQFILLHLLQCYKIKIYIYMQLTLIKFDLCSIVIFKF